MKRASTLDVESLTTKAAVVAFVKACKGDAAKRRAFAATL